MFFSAMLSPLQKENVNSFIKCDNLKEITIDENSSEEIAKLFDMTIEEVFIFEEEA